MGRLNRKIQHTCPHCGESFTDSPSRTRVYCSKACRQAAIQAAKGGKPRRKYRCSRCQRTFSAFPSENRRYCSRLCWQRRKPTDL